MPPRMGWYRLDLNATGDDGKQPGVYVLQARKLDVPAILTDEQKQSLVRQESDDWARIEIDIRRAFARATQALGWAEDDPRRIHYEASATHQEILQGALNLQDEEDRRHVHAFTRTICLPRGQAPHKDFIDCLPDGPDTIARAQQDRLRESLINRLGKANVHSYTLNWREEARFTDDDLKEFCTKVLEQLSKVVESQISTLTKASPGEQEEQAHQDFGAERCRHFVGRDKPLLRITDYLREDADKPLTVIGPSGSGKSAVMAKAVQLARTINLKAQIITRYLGATPTSSDLIQLLRNLVAEIHQRYPIAEHSPGLSSSDAIPGAGSESGLPEGGWLTQREVNEIPYEYKPLLNAFHEALQRPTADQPLWLFFDALDQLTASNNAHALAWLPAKLPAHIHLVVSAALPSTTSGNVAPNAVEPGHSLGGAEAHDGFPSATAKPSPANSPRFGDPRQAVMAALALAVGRNPIPHASPDDDRRRRTDACPMAGRSPPHPSTGPTPIPAGNLPSRRQPAVASHRYTRSHSSDLLARPAASIRAHHARIARPGFATPVA